MAKQLLTIHQDNGSIILIEGDVALSVADNVLHVAVTGRTKRVRHGRQWSEDPQPDETRSFPLAHVLEYRITETD